MSDPRPNNVEPEPEAEADPKGWFRSQERANAAADAQPAHELESRPLPATAAPTDMEGTKR